MRIRKHQTNKARSKLSEKAAASFFGGKVQPASGALPVAALKGDVVTERFLIDDKVTYHKSYAVTIAAWQQHANDAYSIGKNPLVHINFAQGPALVLMDEITFAEIVNTKCLLSSPITIPLRRKKKPRLH